MKNSIQTLSDKKESFWTVYVDGEDSDQHATSMLSDQGIY